MSNPVLIRDWEIVDEHVWGYIMGHPRIGSGEGHTSRIVSRDGDLVTTESGTVYKLVGADPNAPMMRTCSICGKSVEVKPGSTKNWRYRDGQWRCDGC